MSNANVFLSLYNKTDHMLKEKYDLDRNLSFYRTLDEAAERSSIVRRYRRTLKQFGQLRNAIVHEYRDGEIIAEPTESAVTEFQQIYDKLSRPRRVLDIVGTHVVTVERSDLIGTAMDIMSEHDYSQVPVVGESGFVGLFTSSVLFRALADIDAGSTGTIQELRQRRMDDVLSYSDRFRQVKFLPRTASIYDVLELFEDTALKDHQLDAVLLTESGDASQMPVGIVTDSDLPEILAHL